MRLVKRLRLGIREAGMFVRAMQSADHPILVRIAPILRCNLDCS